MVGMDATGNSWIPWIHPDMVSSKVDDAQLVDFRVWAKLPWHIKSATTLSLTIFETSGSVVWRMDLRFAGNCIAIGGKLLEEFVIRIRAFGRRWYICWLCFRPGSAVNV